VYLERLLFEIERGNQHSVKGTENGGAGQIRYANRPERIEASSAEHSRLHIAASLALGLYPQLSRLEPSHN
jgi:hypothetical protein